MQRLVYLYTGTARLVQVVGGNQLRNSKSLFGKSNTNFLNFKRCLATEKKNSSEIDTHPDLYKASTAKEETHVPDDLHSGQSPETFMTNKQSPLTGGGKVWSNQNPADIHVAPLGQIQATKFVPKSTEGGPGTHETTVYTTRKSADLNLADPLTAHTLQPELSPGQLAEAAAVSAFEFAPDTSHASGPSGEAVFAPKISSTDVYSTASSPTAEFETAPETSLHHDPVKYEITDKPKVFGGQDTSADTKKHPNDNTFNSKGQNKAR